MEKAAKYIIIVLATIAVIYCIVSFAKMAGCGVASQFGN